MARQNLGAAPVDDVDAVTKKYVDDADVTSKARANHTGTQLASTISDLSKSSVGLGNVDNTSDANKPVSTAQQTALDLKADIAQPSWTTPTYSSGWSDYGSPFQTIGYFKDTLGMVHLKGMVRNSSGSSKTGNIFTLPAGYRPGATMLTPVEVFNAHGRLDIQADGEVIAKTSVPNTRWITLTNIQFLAEN